MAKGKFDVVGNKGGVAYSFVLCDKTFNIIGCHLAHGQTMVKKRNQMMSNLVQEIKLQKIQADLFSGLESDSYADYSIIMGDLNYRINSTFAFLSKQIETCRDEILDQYAV